MKILMTSDTYLPRLGGGEHHVHYLLRELRKLGEEVTFLTTEQGSDEHDRELVVNRVSYRGVHSLFPIFRRLWRLSREADLIHSHYSYRLAWIASIVALLRRKPFVLTQHGLGLLPQAGARFPYTLLFVLWRRGSMKRAQFIISTSEDLSIEIRALGFGEKIIPIPNGYDPELFQALPPPSGPPVLLTVRRLVPKTGVQYLLQVLPALLRRHPDLTCIIVGEGRMRKTLEDLAENLHISDIVTFTGALPQNELPDYYEQAHIVVLPSTAESTSLTCIEAMASARPIVASRVGGLVELLGDEEERGFLIALTDDDNEHSTYDAPMTLSVTRTEMLEDEISYVLSHREEALEKARSAASYAKEHFPWRRIARETIYEVYKEVQ